LGCLVCRTGLSAESLNAATSATVASGVDARECCFLSREGDAWCAALAFRRSP
jgi:hypothetical protein